MAMVPPPPAFIRAFVAIDIAPDVSTQLKVLWDGLQQELESAGIAWVKPSNWHLTLLFLGDVPMSKIDQCREAWGMACENIAPFELSIGGLGVFPNARRPKVLWASVQGDVEALNALQSRVAIALQPFVAKPDDEPFHAHLTLARIKYSDKVLLSTIGKQLEVHRGTLCGAWTVGEVRLMQSELKPSGAMYSIVEKFELK